MYLNSSKPHKKMTHKVMGSSRRDSEKKGNLRPVSGRSNKVYSPMLMSTPKASKPRARPQHKKPSHVQPPILSTLPKPVKSSSSSIIPKKKSTKTI